MPAWQAWLNAWKQTPPSFTSSYLYNCLYSLNITQPKARSCMFRECCEAWARQKPRQYTAKKGGLHRRLLPAAPCCQCLVHGCRIHQHRVRAALSSSSHHIVQQLRHRLRVHPANQLQQPGPQVAHIQLQLLQACADAPSDTGKARGTGVGAEQARHAVKMLSSAVQPNLSVPHCAKARAKPSLRQDPPRMLTRIAALHC